MEYRRIVLGIGNPGAEYQGTRHNIGFMALDRVAEQRGLTFRRLNRREPGFQFGGKVKAHIALSASASGEPFLLVKPLTYVNLSGDVVGPLLRAASLDPDSLFVVVDDANLPLGRIRVRPAGSAGGHNGLRSIEAALQSPEYPRLRLGIGSATDATMVEHVLGPFLPNEREGVDLVLSRAAEVVGSWLDGDSIQDLMSRHNGSGCNHLDENV